MYRCPECRTRRATWAVMQVHIKKSAHKVCACGGYHYPHRPNSKLCHSNPWSEYYEASRAGATLETLDEIRLNTAWTNPSPSFTCPF